MLALRAALVSCVVARLLCRGATGTVHSVFPRALNLGCGRESVVTVVGRRGTRVPNGVILASDLDLSTLGLQPGSPWIGSSRGLLIGDQVWVELAGGTLWSPVLRCPGAASAMERLARNLPVLWDSGVAACYERGIDGLTGFAPFFLSREDLLSMSPGGDWEGSDFCRVSWPALVGLMKAVRARAASDLLRWAVCFAGMGPGLTPSGDDFLVGLLASARVAAELGGDDVIWSLSRKLSWEARKRTHLLSWSYIDYASRGYFSEPLLEVVMSVLGADENHVAESCRRLVAVGASSGIDGLFGIAVGMELLVASDHSSQGRVPVEHCRRSSITLGGAKCRCCSE